MIGEDEHASSHERHLPRFNTHIKKQQEQQNPNQKSRHFFMSFWKDSNLFESKAKPLFVPIDVRTGTCGVEISKYPFNACSVFHLDHAYLIKQANYPFMRMIFLQPSPSYKCQSQFSKEALFTLTYQSDSYRAAQTYHRQICRINERLQRLLGVFKLQITS